MSAYLQSLTGRVFVLLFVGTTLTFFASFFVIMLRVHHPFVVLFFAAAFLALSFVVARIAMRPVRDLAGAAVKLEKDFDSPPLVERGPSEVRHAAAAFNAMQARIQHDVRERTSMLAAITHDLQTPITRLRLRLEKVRDEALRAKLVEDLAQMSAIVQEGLDLAQSLHAAESSSRIDLDSVLMSACEDATDSGEDVSLAGRTGAFVLGSPASLRRCVTNVVDNAVKYGKCAMIDARAYDGQAIVRVRDRGPGIPEEQLETVLDPFVRIETSRSRETGGTGLGLTIARNIARRLGGSLVLRNHPEGGLEATLTLPNAI